MISFLKRFFAELNDNFNYAVLRNFENLPEKIDSRDIDILILEKDLKAIRLLIYNLAVQKNCSVLYTNQDNQFLTVVIMDKQQQVFQLDLQYNFAWMGIDLLDENVVLKHRVFNGRIYHLDKMFTFLPKYLYCRILGADYPAKYTHVQAEAMQNYGNEINMLLSELSCGGGSIEYWNSHNKWQLRWWSFLSVLRRRPCRAIRHISRFVAIYIMHIFTRRGLMISFTGPDGCGKTTVIDLLSERLAVNPPKLFHFRPSLLPNLGEVGAKAKLTKTVDRNFDSPHRAKKKNVLSSLIRLGYYSLDYVIGYWLKVFPLRQRKHIVFFDRYFTDIIVDHERSSIFLAHRFIAPLRYLLPRCKYNFFFRVAPETILKRKQELTGDAIERIYNRMEYLAARDKHCFWIDNNGSPEDAVRQILYVIAGKNK